MRIAISGGQNVGKSTLLDAFLKKWPMYAYPNKTYRDVLRENNAEHSTKSSDETQLMILDFMMQQQEVNKDLVNVVYDRCTWDNLAYTLHGNSVGRISDEVTAATISFVRESMKNLDIIFWLPKSDKIQMINNGVRETDDTYAKEIEDVFSSLHKQYADQLESDVFYPKEDCPAIIPIDTEFLTVDDRIFYINQFINDEGKLIEDESSILDPANVELMESMLEEQIKVMEEEKQVIDIMTKGNVTPGGIIKP